VGQGSGSPRRLWRMLEPGSAMVAMASGSLALGEEEQGEDE